MFALMRWIWGRVRALATLVLPMLGRAAGGVRSWLFWGIHFLLVVGILAGLFWLNRYWDLPRDLEAPTEWLAQAWLPILFLLFYMVLWVGFWLWRTLRPEARSSPYPDLDAAWTAGVAALQAAGFDLQRLPLFLVLGQPRNGAATLFDVAGLRATPLGNSREAPIQLFLTREAVYLVCRDCSLTGGLSAWAERMDAQPAASSVLSSVSREDKDSHALPSLVMDVPAEPEETPTSEQIPLARDAEELARLTDRLRYLCYHIRQARLPYAPINGVMIATPEACTRTPAQGNQAGYFAAEDLRTVTDALQVRVPAVAVIVDGEQIPGLAEFLDLIPRGKRGQRLGRKLPYVPRLAQEERLQLVQQAVHWITGSLVPRLVYRVMPLGEETGQNTRLFQFIAAISGRRESWIRFYSRALAVDANVAILPGGCYLAATGAAPGEQGFLADVFVQLLESQNFLAWTPAGLAEERSLRRGTIVGYILVSLFTAIVIAGAVVYYTTYRVS
ncbi:MAG: hypothetical protein LC104_10015 [Bacteroidales bacterium]|nr:hypothetical protein [Bacteroidales bacterium]